MALRPANGTPLFRLSRCGKNLKESSNHGSFNSKSYVQEFTGYPRGLLEFKKIGKAFHPTQKPVPLLEYLIKTYTLESETVLDFTMGSGSTGVASVNLNRKFIGIEKEEKYFEIAKERIEKARILAEPKEETQEFKEPEQISLVNIT
jgi:DNA modification methylase